MRKWAKTTGLLFWAAASVYSGRVIGEELAGSAKRTGEAKLAAVLPVSGSASASDTLAAPAAEAPEVKLLDESKEGADSSSSSTDPFANSKTDDKGDESKPAGEESSSTKPAEGTSVSSSQVNMTEAGAVEIHVNDANLVEVLRMLSLQSQKN